jgi:hypothetical protein
VRFLLLTRLPGVRWADHRPHLDDEQSLHVHRCVGLLLRQFHHKSVNLNAQSFGGLSSSDRAWSTLADVVADRVDTLARRYRQTLRNAAFHHSGGAQELMAAYGADGIDQERLAVHDLLHTLEERIWIAIDQPAGWRSAVNRLDRRLQRVVHTG